jgi:hypothetical protein
LYHHAGVSYFRSTKPHIALENNYPDEFHVDVDYEPQIDNDEWLKNMILSITIEHLVIMIIWKNN